jgi:hypothetical protein
MVIERGIATRAARGFAMENEGLMSDSQGCSSRPFGFRSKGKRDRGGLEVRRFMRGVNVAGVAVRLA